MALHIGTSGWQYRDWREAFYPKELKQTEWLGHYSARFDTVEVNNTFYRLPERTVFERWREKTPDHFVFVCKTSRYLTHIKRLKDASESVQLFMERATGLGPKLGPLLVQLPPTMKAEPERLAGALKAFPPEVKVAVEFRHETWFTEEVRRILSDHDAALVWADRHGRDLNTLWRTASWGFVRLHESGGPPPPCYPDEQLESWAARIAAEWGPDADVWFFFNNDPRCCAVENAITFAERATAHGLRPTRVPEPHEVRVWR
ncbi:MAG TPA: DUF72 domain-containing protein [Actinomycetota bacterium]|nr:DUF72 domain-containing protein [Actinomycetota bacterium]